MHGLGGRERRWQGGSPISSPNRLEAAARLAAKGSPRLANVWSVLRSFAQIPPILWPAGLGRVGRDRPLLVPSLSLLRARELRARLARRARNCTPQVLER